MKSLTTKIIIFLLLVANLIPSNIAKAADGLPGTFQFGYGVRVSLEDSDLDKTLNAIEITGFDWIAVDYIWRNHNPQRDAAPQWEKLDQVMNFAQEQDIAVMLSTTSCPSWAMGDNGPSPSETADLIITLAERYPNSLRAVELFPGPNTAQGWGANPNPANYLSLFGNVKESLEANNIPLELIVGGLVPLSTQESTSNDINDLDFLEGLYEIQTAAATDTILTTIGMRLPLVVGNPKQGDSPHGTVIRHYEEIRQVMLNHAQQDHLIWLTGFSPPSALTNNLSLSSLEQQTQWLQEAYFWISSQIYIGAAFFTPQPNNSTNPSEYALFALQSLQQQIISKKQYEVAAPNTHSLKASPKSFNKTSHP